MIWSAPSFLRTSALESEEVVEMTRAPAALANYGFMPLAFEEWMWGGNKDTPVERTC